MTESETTPLDELIDLCVQADRADGKIVPILPSTFFVGCAFALSAYKDLLEGTHPDKKIISFGGKTARNCRMQKRYDDLMKEGKQGHYETMFKVWHEEFAI